MKRDWLAAGEYPSQYFYFKRKTVFEKSKKEQSEIHEFGRKLYELGFYKLDAGRLLERYNLEEEVYREEEMYRYGDSNICVIVSSEVTFDISYLSMTSTRFGPKREECESDLIIEVTQFEDKNIDHSVDKPKSVIYWLKEKLTSYFQHRVDPVVDKTELLKLELEQKIKTLACMVFDQQYKMEK